MTDILYPSSSPASFLAAARISSGDCRILQSVQRLAKAPEEFVRVQTKKLLEVQRSRWLVFQRGCTAELVLERIGKLRAMQCCPTCTFEGDDFQSSVCPVSLPAVTGVFLSWVSRELGPDWWWGGCGRVACATLSLQVGRTDQTYLWQCRATRTRESRLHDWQSSAESFFPTAGHGSELVHPTFVGVAGMCSSVGWTV